MFGLKRFVLPALLIFSFCLPARVQAEPMKTLFMSSAYGVLAGTLVGAASLAFTDHPGDNLRNVARGASLGLYAGILLGLYVIYLVPDDEEDLPYSPYETPAGFIPSFEPVIADNGSLQGGQLEWTLSRF